MPADQRMIRIRIGKILLIGRGSIACVLCLLSFSGISANQHERGSDAALARLDRLLGLKYLNNLVPLPKTSIQHPPVAGQGWDGTPISIIGKGWSAPFYSRGPSSLVSNLKAAPGGFIATGEFSGADEITSALVARWSGAAWSSQLSGFRIGNGWVVAALPFGESVIVGGLFDSVSSIPCANVARWSGAAWQCMEAGLSTITALADWNGSILAAAADEGILSWNGSKWTRMGSRMSGVVSRMETIGGKIWIAGDFTMAEGNAVQNLAVWNGAEWKKPHPATTIDPVRDLAWAGSEVFIIQNHDVTVGLDTQTVRKWDGLKWEYCGFSQNMAIKQSLSADSQNVYLVGSTANIYALGFAKGTDMSGVMVSKWISNGFQTVATAGIDGDIFTAAISGGDLILGGAFSRVGAIRADNLVRWNGSGFQALSNVSSPPPPFKSATLFSDGQAIYFGRSYGVVENTSNGAIFRWNGSLWDSLDGGFKNTVGPLNGTVPMVRVASVNAIASIGAKIIAGGMFDSTARLPARNIAQWNGASWEPMGTGYEGIVHAIQPFGGEVIVAGNPEAEGVMAKDPRVVSRWSGSKWEPMPGGMEGVATGLIEYKGALYAAGSLKFPGDWSYYCLAKWNGVIWTPVAGFDMNAINGAPSCGDFKAVDQSMYILSSTGLWRWDGANRSGRVLEVTGAYAMAVSGKDLFLYGNIRTPDSLSCLVAKWDGVRCTPLAMGEAQGYMQISRMPMTVYKGSLYLSTERITEVNGKNAPGYAVFDLDEGAVVRRPSPKGKSRSFFQSSGMIFGYGIDAVRMDGRALEKATRH